MDIGAIQHKTPAAEPESTTAQPATRVGPFERFMVRTWSPLVRGHHGQATELELTKATSPSRLDVGKEGSDFSGKTIYSVPSTPTATCSSHKIDLPNVLRWTSNKASGKGSAKSGKQTIRGDASDNSCMGRTL